MDLCNATEICKFFKKNCKYFCYLLFIKELYPEKIYGFLVFLRKKWK